MQQVSRSSSSNSLIEMARQPQDSSEDAQSGLSAVPARDSYLARAVTWLKKEEPIAGAKLNFMNIIVSIFPSCVSLIEELRGSMKPNLAREILGGFSISIGSLLALKTAYQIWKTDCPTKTVYWQLIIGVVGMGCGFATVLIAPNEDHS